MCVNKEPLYNQLERKSLFTVCTGYMVLCMLIIACTEKSIWISKIDPNQIASITLRPIQNQIGFRLVQNRSENGK